MTILSSSQKANRAVSCFLYLFFIMSAAEVFAEVFSLKALIYVIKPLLNPLLIVIYLLTSKVRNPYFITALIFACIANIFFISSDSASVAYGSIFFIIFKLLVIYLVVKALKIANYFPILLGTIPFMFIFLYITSLTYDELGELFYLYLAQVVCICFLGGFSLSNFIIDNNKMNYWLMISALLSTIIQFILILKMYFIPIFIFQPLAMILYFCSQFALYKFVQLSENEVNKVVK